MISIDSRKGTPPDLKQVGVFYHTDQKYVCLVTPAGYFCTLGFLDVEKLFDITNLRDKVSLHSNADLLDGKNLLDNTNLLEAEILNIANCCFCSST